mmetsp:Transcript_13028/g.17891  ORF Transcript_13028/g.17891 Transcript_13028/m.17891 type:complete len:128 (-) Transcript_13028:22-405(-)
MCVMNNLLLFCDNGAKIVATDPKTQFSTFVAGVGFDSQYPSEGPASYCLLQNPKGMCYDGGIRVWIATNEGLQVMLCYEFGWNKQRLLWIGRMKHSYAECPFALLPRELIREIIKEGNQSPVFVTKE